MYQDNIFDHTRLKKKLYLAHKKYIVRLGYFEDRRKFTFWADDGHWWIQTSKVILFYIIWFWSILLQRKFLFFLMISRYFYRQIRLVSCTIIQTKNLVLEN